MDNLKFGEAIPVLNLPLNGDNSFEVSLDLGRYYVEVYDRFRNLLLNETLIVN